MTQRELSLQEERVYWFLNNVDLWHNCSQYGWEIKKRIQILLSNSVVSPVEDNYGFKSFTFDDVSRIQELKKSIVLEDPAEWRIQNEHADTLIKLYRQLPRKGQLEMISLLGDYLLDGSSKYIKGVAALVLVNTDNADALADVII